MERKKYNKHFFEPEDALENYPYKIDISIQEKYEKINKFFNSIYPEKILEKAKKDAKKEQEDRNLDKNNFIYGETTFRTISYLLEYLTNTLKIDSNGFFYDLGSGTGKAVIAMSLIRKFKKCIGIEYLENLTVLSKRFEENYNKKILEVIEDEKLFKGFNKKPNIIEFVNGDFLKRGWSEASVILMNSTCFTIDLILFNMCGKRTSSN
jgi:tRNA G46 methylase TrmB